MKKSITLAEAYKISNREACIGLGLVLLHFVGWFSLSYGLGSGPVEDYHYVFGFPAWFFYSCIAGFLVIFLLVAVTVSRFFSDIPFEYDED